MKNRSELENITKELKKRSDKNDRRGRKPRNLFAIQEYDRRMGERRKS